MNVRSAITIAFLTAIVAACSVEERGLRSIRGHVHSKGGIAHGAPMLRAERYCKHCHGEKLLGGAQNEPSCYKCHGQRWRATDPEQIFAPEGHNQDRGGYFHHEGIAQVQTTCISCHGASLEGDGEDGAPSCYLCHDALWQ